MTILKRLWWVNSWMISDKFSWLGNVSEVPRLFPRIPWLFPITAHSLTFPVFRPLTIPKNGCGSNRGNFERLGRKFRQCCDIWPGCLFAANVISPIGFQAGSQAVSLSTAPLFRDGPGGRPGVDRWSSYRLPDNECHFPIGRPPPRAAQWIQSIRELGHEIFTLNRKCSCLICHIFNFKGFFGKTISRGNKWNHF